ncbi:voltage-gated potassium channel [Palleronia aestuarii]|uniref:Voltage-gated potassium channel n=1 Tax=Palleronia aestuarii TaxID=568105 RepID=A0A2W7NSI6_9RHOB|nr:ion channel [Palleronia aestuarii]PZX16246.1 voltage-gated potassium channel [Palleronia aestuarii]
MKATLRTLYEGDGAAGRWFRAGLLVFDLATIAYFLVTATAKPDATLLIFDTGIGALVALDVAARCAIAERKLRFLLSLPTLADLVVLASLAVPIVTGSNLGFLRVLRILRLMRTFRLAERLDGLTQGWDVNTRVVVAAANLAAFIFVVTSLVWVWEHDRNENVATYVDALYFTVTTLTTTGYGDITLTDRVGRIMTIGIMVFGVGFFLKLLQALYQPAKIEQRCRQCGLELHDRDASHCKHCGSVIYIETEGDT